MTRKTYCGNLLWQSGLTLLAPEWSVTARVAQVGAGKIFGSEAFVRKWIDGLDDKFPAARTAAHAVGSIGFSSHGWRLAKRDERAA